jgi:threonine synthase
MLIIVQDTVKALFADRKINETLNLGAVNSINWARILAQTTYYFHAYFTLTKSPAHKADHKVRFVVVGVLRAQNPSFRCIASCLYSVDMSLK